MVRVNSHNNMANPPANLPFEPLPPTGGSAPVPPPPAPKPPMPPAPSTPPPVMPRPMTPPPAPAAPTISTMPPVAKSSEPEDIFSNLERAQKGGMARPATGPMMQVPRNGGGMGRTILTVFIVVLVVVALGGGAFWYLLIRPQGDVTEQPTIPTPSPTSNTPPVPTGITPSIPTNQGLPTTTESQTTTTGSTTLP